VGCGGPPAISPQRRDGETRTGHIDAIPYRAETLPRALRSLDGGERRSTHKTIAGGGTFGTRRRGSLGGGVGALRGR